jgi:hypothetical protein
MNLIRLAQAPAGAVAEPDRQLKFLHLLANALPRWFVSKGNAKR